MKMYLVGFYSPKEKSGVTQKSLAVFQWLRNHTSLKVAFVSNETLLEEPLSDAVHHEFGLLTMANRKKQMTRLKREFDLVIYDASSKLTDEVLQLLPLFDRLFILGEDNIKYAQTLRDLLQFDKMFDTSVRRFVHQLQDEKTYVVQDRDPNFVGFTHLKRDAGELGEIIYNHWVSHALEHKLVDKHAKMVAKIKKSPPEELETNLYNLGFSFDKALLFGRYVRLRVAMGQPWNEAVDDVYMIMIHQEYDFTLKKFQNELIFVQMSFGRRQDPST